jgi:hypothetical protein
MTKRLVLATLIVLFAVQPAHAGFAEIARAIDAHQGVNRIYIPLLGLARFAVRVVAPEGVHDFQLATFEGAADVDARELHAILKAKIGPGFTPLVQVWSRRQKEWSFIYARPHGDGKRIELVVLTHDHSDTVLVRVEVDANKLARTINDSPRGVIRIASH